ncbi:MAG: response regulator [Nibricoccus sp.]
MTSHSFQNSGKGREGGTRSPLAAEAEPPSQTGAGIRILLADDDEVLRVVQSDFLRRFGYEVLASEDGRAAMKSLAEQPVDLVITDMVMPGSDGVEVIRHIRKQYPQLKIIAISGGGATKRELLLDIARVLGVRRTLEKPFTMTALLKTVREVIDEK